MKLHRFFSAEKIFGLKGATVMPTGTPLTYTDVSSQWQKVLRFTACDQVILFDGSGFDFHCEIKELRGETVILSLIEQKKNTVLPRQNVVLYAALVKKDTFEWIVQKATELGVSDIVPVLAERSEKKNINTERLQKIIVEASEQSGRGTLPHLHEIQSLKEFFVEHGLPGTHTIDVSQWVAFDPRGEKLSRESNMDKVGDGAQGTAAVFIGPEGGWSAIEIEAFVKAGISVQSLGPQVLRTETAVVAALSQFVF